MSHPALPGLLPGKVFLIDSQPEWAALFAEEATRIGAALGARVAAIEHYGSTSIPGIKAKPVIDLLIGMPRLDDALGCQAEMEALGYDFAPYAGVPGHHVFGKERARTHLAHFVEHGGEAWTNCLAFRDRLRADPERARAYERLKLELAAKFPEDRASYSAAKTVFVAETIAL